MLRSTSVSELNNAKRRANRAERKPKQKRKLPIALIVVVVSVVALFVGAIAVYNSSLFKVAQINVSGVTHLTQEELTALANVPAESTLLRIDTDEIENRLETNPWVEEAVVERIFPDTINLAIKERSIAALVEVKVDEAASTQTWALSNDGHWLVEIPVEGSPEADLIAPQILEDAKAALYITDVPYGSEPVAGEVCSNAHISNALDIITGMTTDLANQVKYVSATDVDSTTLTLANGIEVAFGAAEDIRDKERVVLELINRYPNQISYINVRDASNPIWRSV